MNTPFRVAVTHDVLGADGRPWSPDLGLEAFDAQPGLEWEVLAEPCDALQPEHLARYDAVLLLAPRLTASALEHDGLRTSLVARFGVGYDQVDVAACTRAGVLLTNTPDAVRRPVASAMLAMVLALAHRIRERDLLVRQGRWDEKFGVTGIGLTGRTLGIVGLGSIGMEFARLVAPLDMRLVAFDPYADPSRAGAAGIDLCSLEELLEQADFVCIAAPLTPDTHHLIDSAALRRMKSTAYVVNAARGPIIDQPAIVEALTEGWIAGAALDVFDPEPIEPGDPLLGLDNVLLTPHNIAHTDELYRRCGRSAVASILDFARGVRPGPIVNPDALNHERLRGRFRLGAGGGS